MKLADLYTTTCLSAVLLSMTCAGTVLAAPEGAQVAAGSANISSPQSGHVVIQQHTDKAVINWNQFDIKAGEHTEFRQPSQNASTLNRIKGNAPSNINGRLTANGNIVVVNPHGVVFGKNAKVDVGGLVASTADIADENFMKGTLGFDRPGKADAAIINHGVITAKDAGLVGLVAPHVENHGTIQARLGKIVLASGETATVDMHGDGLIQVAASGDSKKLLVSQQGTLLSEGGTIALTAADGRNMLDSLIQADGALSAASIQHSGGRIVITGQDSDIEVNADMDVSGMDKAGSLYIGGDFKGNGTLPTARNVTLNKDAVIRANVRGDGKGGTVIVWSDEQTRFAGTIEAKGSAGGFVETSGKQKLNIADSASVDTQNGTWLLDPQDFTIADSGGDMTPAALQTNLASNNVTITNAAGAGNGDITISDAVSWSSSNTLTLDAIRHVQVDDAISNSAGGNLILRADKNGTGTGTVNFGGGGSVSMNTGRSDIYYNPTSYTTPTNYAANVTGTFDAWMLVHDVNDLQDISGNKSGNYALSKDIDASATTGWNGGLGFNAIGFSGSEFTGKFNGQNFAINNLFINRPSQGNLGMFGGIDSAEIKNVRVLSANITGQDDTGILAGDVEQSTITNVHTSGNVTGNISVGGLIGEASDSTTITQSSSAANVSGNGEVGGLIGDHEMASSTSNSFATGNVTSAGDNIGGLIGNNDSVTVSDSYSTGSVTGNYRVGGLVGENSTNSTITNSYSTSNVNADRNVGGLTGDNNNNSTITNSYATGIITAGDDNAGGLVGLLSGNSTITTSYATGNVSGEDDVGGLVGDSEGTISNSYATGSVTARDNVGGFAGRHDNGATTSNSYALGNISGRDNVGGFIGLNDSATSTNNYATGTVSGRNSVGGLVGSNAGTSSVTQSYATGNITATAGSLSIGGLVGEHKDNATITSSYATGDISGDGDCVGGLVGWAMDNARTETSFSTGNITIGAGRNIGGLTGLVSNDTVTLNSYATGIVNGDDDVGGLVGEMRENAVLNFVYSTGQVSGNTDVGGLIGLRANASSVTNGYWNVTTSGQATSNAGTETGLTTAQMMDAASFTGFDIATTGGSSNVWRIYEGNTAPLLRSFLTPLNVKANDATMTFNGSAYNGSEGVTYTTFNTGDNSSNLLGTLDYGSSDTDIGTYVLTPSGLYDDQFGYDISYSTGTLNITVAPPAPSAPTIQPTSPKTKVPTTVPETTPPSSPQTLPAPETPVVQTPPTSKPESKPRSTSIPTTVEIVSQKPAPESNGTASVAKGTQRSPQHTSSNKMIFVETDETSNATSKGDIIISKPLAKMLNLTRSLFD